MMNFQQGYGQQQQAHGGYNAGWGQQQQQQAGKAQAGGHQQAPAQGGTIANATHFTVSGCTHATVGPTVRGSFALAGENHGRRTYKRDGQVGGVDVMLYFWDERDGPNFCGWWFGPKVGGDQVWAYHNQKDAQTPPLTGWKVPYDGPVDATMMLAPGQAMAAQKPAGFGQQMHGKGQVGGFGQQMQSKGAQMQSKGGGGMGGFGQSMQNQQQGGGNLNSHQMQLMQMQQQRQAQQEMQKQQMEENRKRLEENKRKMEEANRIRMEEAKKKQEELAKKKQEELQKRAEETKKKQEEMRAASVVRKALQRLRFPNLETIDECRKELDEAVAAELEACGSMKETIENEVKSAREQADAKVKQMEEQKKKIAEQKEAEEKKRKEQIEVAAKSLAELGELVKTATEGANSFKEKAEAFLAKEDLSPEVLESVSAEAGTAGDKALEKTHACQAFLKEKNKDLQEPPRREGDPEKDPSAPTMQSCIKQLSEANTIIQTHRKKLTDGKTTALKKAHAKVKLGKLKNTLEKYDKSKKGALSRKELLAYAKTEFKFTIPTSDVDIVCKVLAGEKGDLPLTHLHRIRASVGIFREKAMDAQRRADRLAKEKEVEEQRQKLQGHTEQADKCVDEAENEIKAMEAVSNPLAGKAKPATSKEALAMASEVDEKVEAAKAAVSKAKTEVDELKTEVEELQPFLRTEIAKLRKKMGSFESRLTRATTTVSKVREEAGKKVQQELLAIRKTALAMIRHHQSEKGLNVDKLYAGFDGNNNGSVNESEFLGFFSKCEKKEGETVPSDEDLSRFFEALDEEKQGQLKKETVYGLIRLHMKVLKETVVTEDLLIKGTKTLRRLDLNEMCEVIDGPALETDTDIKRVKVKMLKDDVVGWCTPVGNQGTIFLQESALEMKVIKDTIMTPTLAIADSKETTKKLKPGEIVEVLEWMKKDEASGLMRAKVKTKDGKAGWASTVGNTGIVLMELV